MTRFTRSLPLVVMLLLLIACGTPAASSPTTSVPVVGTAEVATSVAAAQTITGQDMVLNVFAAASLTDAFGEIGKNFEQASGATLTFNFAGSNQLAQQIGQGAPVDVFASANRTQLEVVIKSGQIISGTQRTFVRNRLVLIYPQENPAQIQQLADLAKPGIKLVLADKAVPVGALSLDFLKRASALPEYTESFSTTVLANVVSYEENVRAVLSKVSLGEADAGVVYTSDISQDATGKVGRIDIPDNLNTIAAYPIAPIKDSSNAALAQRFIDYVLGPDGQAILVKYGFIAAADG